jgi:hypothetical protein
MPEWYLVIAGLGLLSALGIFWRPLLLALPLLVLAIGPPVAQSILNAAQATFPREIDTGSGFKRLKLRSLTGFLHIIHPLVRLNGRLRCGLTPWRRRGVPHFAFPRPRTDTIWNEQWQSPENRLETIEAVLRDQRAVVMRGGDFDRWDLEVRGGFFGVLRTRMVIEEHGGGQQLVRLRSWPKFSHLGLTLTFLFLILATLAASDQAWPAAAMLGIIAILLALRTFGDCAAATAAYLHGLKHPRIIGEQ